jgi:hypothetical protein
VVGRRRRRNRRSVAGSGRSRAQPSRAEVCSEGFALDLAEKEKRRARSG